MKILGLLQNQWLTNPDQHRRFLARYPHLRRDAARRLFLRSHSGRRFLAVFGDHVGKFIFEEATPEIADTSSEVLVPDLDHIKWAVADIKPELIIAFGKVAEGALKQLSIDHIPCLHPAARRFDIFQTIGRQICKRIEEGRR